MTFILHLLEHDFSLFVSDGRAMTKGEDDRDIISEDDSFKFLFLGERRVLVTTAGYDKGHYSSYLKDFPDDQAMCGREIVSTMMERIFSSYATAFSSDKADLYKHGFSAIASYFDVSKDQFVTLRCDRGKTNISFGQTLVSSDSAALLWQGSGSSSFYEAVGKENIDEFVGSITDVNEVPRYCNWMRLGRVDGFDQDH